MHGASESNRPAQAQERSGAPQHFVRAGRAVEVMPVDRPSAFSQLSTYDLRVCI
jgi:hypothetical protein